MASTRETMVAKYGGEEGYREHMREIRAKVNMDKHSGGAFNNKKFAKKMAKKGSDVRWNKPSNSPAGVSPAKEK